MAPVLAPGPPRGGFGTGPWHRDQTQNFLLRKALRRACAKILQVSSLGILTFLLLSRPLARPALLPSSGRLRRALAGRLRPAGATPHLAGSRSHHAEPKSLGLFRCFVTAGLRRSCEDIRDARSGHRAPHRSRQRRSEPRRRPKCRGGKAAARYSAVVGDIVVPCPYSVSADGCCSVMETCGRVLCLRTFSFPSGHVDGDSAPFSLFTFNTVTCRRCDQSLTPC